MDASGETVVFVWSDIAVEERSGGVAACDDLFRWPEVRFDFSCGIDVAAVAVADEQEGGSRLRSIVGNEEVKMDDRGPWFGAKMDVDKLERGGTM